MQQVHPSKYYPDRKDIRLTGYDCSTHGNYFLTIVTKDREDLFGTVVDGMMVHNEAGQMLLRIYEEMKHFSDVIIPADMVVMPNHVHCIIGLCQDDGMSIPNLMRNFKSKTTVEYIHGVKQRGWRRFNGTLWQARYYDHIIRCQSAYDKIREYIWLNPSRWEQDKLNKGQNAECDDINAMIKQYEIW